MQLVDDRDFDFSDLKDEEIQALRVRKVTDARSLNIISPGLNLHFMCANQKDNCEAFGRSVKIQKKFGNFSVGK